MRKIFLVFLLAMTLGNFIILVMALTNQSEFFNQYRLIIGLSFLMFGGFLRQHLVRNTKIAKEQTLKN
jgi:hypothetical protein